jgi:hypothetical protein
MKKTTLTIHPLIKAAIRDAVEKALKAKPVQIHLQGTRQEGYEIDGDIWNLYAGIEHILGEYSWWKE